MDRDLGMQGVFSGVKDMDTVEGVACSVTSCYHNRHGHNCTAGSISVGSTNAACTDDTLCVTYRKR